MNTITHIVRLGLAILIGVTIIGIAQGSRERPDLERPQHIERIDVPLIELVPETAIPTTPSSAGTEVKSTEEPQRETKRPAPNEIWVDERALARMSRVV